IALSTSTWTAIGPAPIETAGGLGPISGRIQVAVPDPANAGVLYVGGDNGGIWKKIGSAGWVPLTDDQPSLHFDGYHSLVVHPMDSNRIYGITSGPPGGGLLTSTDGGSTWQLLGPAEFDGGSGGCIAVHPTETNTLYVSAGAAGVWESNDGAATWQQLTTLPAGSVIDLIIAKFAPKTLYAAVVGNAGNNGIYRSTDGGASWNLLSALPSGAALSAARLESGSGAGIVYAAILTSGPPANATLPIQRFKTSDGGSTWNKLNASHGTPELRSWHLLLGVDPANDNHIFANDAYSIYESTDSGNTWSQADAGVGYLASINHFDWVNLAFDANGDAVLTADQGVLRFSLHGAGWTSLIDNLQVSEFYTVTVDPQDSAIVYAVGQDIFTEKTTGALQWNVMENSIGETGKILVDPSNSSRLCAFNPTDTSNFVRHSFTGGANWTTIFPADLLSAAFLAYYNASPYWNFAYPAQKSFAMDPANPDRLLVAADVVFETTDASDGSPTWTPISVVLSQNSSLYVSALAIAPSDGNTIYAATPDGHLWVTHDNGANWARCDSGLNGVLVDLRIDPADKDHVFGVAGNDVWELLPSTLVWENRTGNLPDDLSLQTIFVEWRVSVPDLFVGTSRGVYISEDLGNTWAKFGAGLPNTQVNDLQGRVSDNDPTLRILVAGTYGRGAWGILIPVPRDLSYLDPLLLDARARDLSYLDPLLLGASVT
ncbi:MAG: hypothetical protein WCC84_11535, partial [Candidatus Cybelea sp.]